uniref:EB domain-containing protein n=1 Tax=Heterorhabditis bacteriophora TaxID=37862 RepID=A0A1I7X534_HETBA
MSIATTFIFVIANFISFYSLTKISKMRTVFAVAYLVAVVSSFPTTEEGSGLIDESSGFMPVESSLLEELPCMRKKRDDVEASGRCFGAFVGRCNCNACLNFWRCEEDIACGGLKGACNTTINTCDCFQGYKQAGYPQYIDALRKLCNQKVCNKKNATEECHGLPCNSGRCVC